MIQRIQTHYLLLAAGLVACAAFLPLASFMAAAKSSAFTPSDCGRADGETRAIDPLHGHPAGIGVGAAAGDDLPVQAPYAAIPARRGGDDPAAGRTDRNGIYYFLSYRRFSSFEFHAQSVKLPLVLPLIASDLHLSGRPCHFPGRTDDPFDGPHPLRKYTTVCDADPFPDGSASALFPPEKKIRPERAKKHYTFSILSAKIYRF